MELREDGSRYTVPITPPGRDQAEFREEERTPATQSYMAYDRLAHVGALGWFSSALRPPGELQNRYQVVPGGGQSTTLLTFPNIPIPVEG